jgi:hypothetical protein
MESFILKPIDEKPVPYTKTTRVQYTVTLKGIRLIPVWSSEKESYQQIIDVMALNYNMKDFKKMVKTTYTTIQYEGHYINSSVDHNITKDVKKYIKEKEY